MQKEKTILKMWDKNNVQKYKPMQREDSITVEMLQLFTKKSCTNLPLLQGQHKSDIYIL